MNRKFNAAIMRSLLRVKVKDEEVWRSDEDGRHFRIETETGTITAGFGGALNGQKIKPKKSEKPAEVQGLYKNKGFAAISHNARDYKDYNSFVRSLTDNQRKLIQDQHRATNTTESLSEYTERIRKLMAEHPAEEVRKENKVVDGKDMISTFKRRKDKFEYEIDDVVDAQGFNGVPKVVPKAEFEKAVKAANGGKGFIAQRTYSAPNQETLDSYRDMLYHGKWYINCETGGAQYGQGMYCAADYNGELTDGIRAEMKHYSELNEDRRNVPDVDWRDIDKERDQRYDAIIDDLYHKYDYSPYEDYPEDSVQYKLHAEADRILDMSLDDYAKEFHPELFTARSYVETFTLTPDAKVITYGELRSQLFDTLRDRRKEIHDSVANDRIEAMDLPEDEANYLRWKLDVKPYDIEKGSDYIREQELTDRKGLIQVRQAIESDIKKAQDNDEIIEKIWNMDEGAFAALMGYDAINAEGHGESGSYTVILNRTKCIFLEP